MEGKNRKASKKKILASNNERKKKKPKKCIVTESQSWQRACGISEIVVSGVVEGKEFYEKIIFASCE